MYLVISAHTGNPPYVTIVSGEERDPADQAFYEACRENLSKYTESVFLMKVTEENSTELLRSVYCSEGNYLFDPDGNRDFSMMEDGDRHSEGFRRFILKEDGS